MTINQIPETCTIPAKSTNILGSKINYLEAGSGDPILFLHGIPASSYLWRNIIPYLSNLGRCIAPDLVGCGHSEKPDIAYSVFDHIHYIDELINALKLKNVTLVMHGWGSVIGLSYAMKHQANCKGLVFYEPFLDVINEENSLAYEEQVNVLKQQISNAEAIDCALLVKNIFRQLVMRPLSQIELQQYSEPFLAKNTVKPILQYINELPSSGKITTIHKLIADYTQALTHSDLPKLMLYSVPGFITTMATVMWAKQHLSHLEVVDIGEELHFGQESHPDLIGKTISAWLQAAELSHE